MILAVYVEKFFRSRCVYRSLNIYCCKNAKNKKCWNKNLLMIYCIDLGRSGQMLQILLGDYSIPLSILFFIYSVHMCFQCFSRYPSPLPVEYPEKGALRCLSLFWCTEPGIVSTHFTRGRASSKCGGEDEERRLKIKKNFCAKMSLIYLHMQIKFSYTFISCVRVKCS